MGEIENGIQANKNNKSKTISNHIGLIGGLLAIILSVVTLFSSYGDNKSSSAVTDANNSLEIVHLQKADTKHDEDLRRVWEVAIANQTQIVTMTGEMKNINQSLKTTNELFKEIILLQREANRQGITSPSPYRHNQNKNNNQINND